MSTTRLSAALKELGQPIPPTGITRIEKGERRVDADDLVALAIALRVTPDALLLPPTLVGEVDLTRGKTVAATVAWFWVTGKRALDVPADDDGSALVDLQMHSLPVGMRQWRPRPEEFGPGSYDSEGTFHPSSQAIAENE